MTAEDRDLQKLWIATSARAWRTLAVVPAAATISSIDVANQLADIAWQYSGKPTSVLDLRNVRLRLLDYQLEEIKKLVDQGENVILALDAVSDNPTTIPIASKSDAAVLLVRLGETDAKGAGKTIEEIGHAKFVGSILVRKSERAKTTSDAPAPEKKPSGAGP